MSRSTHQTALPRRPIPSNKQFNDLAGGKFGRLTVVHYTGKIEGRKTPHSWLCKCDCGNKVIAFGVNLNSGNTQSCGCLHSKRTSETHKKHGHRRNGGSPEHHSYYAIKSRCYNKNNIGYHLYGGRGITMCDRWLIGGNGKSGFECFFEDMGHRPGRGFSVDRVKVDGNYSPENCRWATVYQQARNTRRNRWVDFRGERMILSDAIRLSGLKRGLVYQRLSRGKSMEQALTTRDLREVKLGN